MPKILTGLGFASFRGCARCLQISETHTGQGLQSLSSFKKSGDFNKFGVLMIDQPEMLAKCSESGYAARVTAVAVIRP